MQRNLSFYRIVIFLFVLGMLAGVIGARLVYGSYKSEVDEFFGQIETNLAVKNDDANALSDATDLFLSITLHQLKRMGLLLVFSISLLALPYLGGFLLYRGCIVGFLLGNVFLFFGAKGLLLAASLFFPQSFLYLPAYLSILKQSYQMGLEGRDRQAAIKAIPTVFTALLLLLTGCVLEAYGNSWILRQVFSVLL
jgi:uncharacterized membrane protein SpoIIM required for sporulation